MTALEGLMERSRLRQACGRSELAAALARGMGRVLLGVCLLVLVVVASPRTEGWAAIRPRR
jgi:hypothetical protein